MFSTFFVVVLVSLLACCEAQHGSSSPADKLGIDDSTSPDHYFEMYPVEILGAMVGTYSSGYNSSDEMIDKARVLQIVSNDDVASRIFLPGIAYIDDGKMSSMTQLSSSSPVANTRLLDPLSQLSNNQLSHLKLDTLPKEFTVVTASDPRVQIVETTVTKENVPKAPIKRGTSYFQL